MTLLLSTNGMTVQRAVRGVARRVKRFLIGTNPRQYVDGMNRIGGSYHRIDWGNGLVIQGIFDMRKYLPHFAFPDDLRGKKVLDVGTASGFFAFECVRRGATVTAIDLMPNRDQLFKTARKAGLNVDFVCKNIYDLDASFGQFDFVVCGSLLLHLSDPFRAIQRLRSVCTGQAVVSTATNDTILDDPRPLCEFMGKRAVAGDGEYWTYWEMNGAALKKMFVAAGFGKAEETGRFHLTSEPGMMHFIVPHVVVKATV